MQAHLRRSFIVHTATSIAASATTTAQPHRTHTASSLHHQLENDDNIQQPDVLTRWSYRAVLPTSFEASDHELAKLRHWFKECSSEGTAVNTFMAKQTPFVAVSAEHSDCMGGTVLAAHHIRGEEPSVMAYKPSSFSISDRETVNVETVAVTVSMPLEVLSIVEDSHDQQNVWAQQDESLDEVLRSLWSLSNEHAVVLASDSHADVDHSFATDDSFFTDSSVPQPRQFILEMEGLSAWALFAYTSVICALFLVTVMWLAFIFLRALLSTLVKKLWGTIFPAGEGMQVRAVKAVGSVAHYEVVEVHSVSEKVDRLLLSA